MNMLSQDDLKKQVAMKAIDFIQEDMVIGVGTGSTVNAFIDELAKVKSRIEACVSSSNETTSRLRAKGIPVVEMTSVQDISLYFDGADEINERGEMIKGGGGALTREKIIASYAKKFICLVDESKKKKIFTDFPVALEVIPMARSVVGRELLKLGANPEYRAGFMTDNGNIIIDVYQLDLVNPPEMELKLNSIVGVVENGIFAHRIADEVLMGTLSGVKHW
jgi:ribose 5-phosphate isomerase A